MAVHRHPHADSFRSAIESLRLLTARLDDPKARGPVLPRMRAGILQILRANPRPSHELCRQLYDIQGHMHKLFLSARNEYAIVAKINIALARAKALVDKPPFGSR